MDIKLIIIGILLILPVIAVKFIPALLFLGPFLIFFVLLACSGLITIIVGVSKFTNTLKQSFTNTQKIEEKTD
jgi:hypothetical protein